jgi:hypothetical protein
MHPELEAPPGVRPSFIDVGPTRLSKIRHRCAASGPAANDAMGVMRHAIGEERLDHRVDVPGVEQPVDPVDEVNCAHSVGCVDWAVE